MRTQTNENQLEQLVAPALGLVGGAVAITAAVEQLGIPRDFAGFGAAAIAWTASGYASGPAREALLGAAAAGVCIGALDLLETFRPKLVYGDKPDTRQVAAADAVTRADVDKLLADLATKHQTELRERDAKQSEAAKEVQAGVKLLSEKLREASATIAALRAGAATKEPVSAVDHIQKIYALLPIDERKQLSTVLGQPSEASKRLEERLLELAPPAAVAFLRKQVFSLRRQA